MGLWLWLWLRLGLGLDLRLGLGIGVRVSRGLILRTRRTLQLGLDADFGHANRCGFNSRLCRHRGLWTSTSGHSSPQDIQLSGTHAAGDSRTHSQATGQWGLDFGARVPTALGSWPRLQRALRVRWVIEVVLHFGGALIAGQVGVFSTPRWWGGAKVLLALGTNG